MWRFMLTSLVGTVILISQIWQSWPDEYVHLIFCDVGQGDAILITSGYNQLLIDGGRGTQVLPCLEEHLPFWDRSIEVMVITHADEDHIGGLDEVLANYHVSQIITTKFDKDSDSFNSLKQAIEIELNQGAELIKPILGQQIRFSQDQTPQKWSKQHLRPAVTFIVLSPRVSQEENNVENLVTSESSLSAVERFFSSKLAAGQNYNDLSIVLFLQVGSVRALLVGDLEVQGELALLESYLLQSADILKVGHHGSKTSTSDKFLEVIRPETSIISVGKANSYGHPSPEVIDRLMQFDSRILRTDEKEIIELVSDGEKYWVVGGVNNVGGSSAGGSNAGGSNKVLGFGSNLFY
ncbi:MBL fold metallo-hydrolase [Patescibacteria group bacterium]|nr:MBL fold metallo-hydrolase [Patescibacteria group bacterium]